MGYHYVFAIRLISHREEKLKLQRHFYETILYFQRPSIPRQLKNREPTVDCRQREETKKKRAL